MPCSHEDCPRSPKWVPVLELRSGPRAVPRVLKFMRLGYCDEHRGATTLGSLLSEEGFNKIAKILRESGKEKISRDATTLAWRPMSYADKRRLSRSLHHTHAAPEPDDEELAF